MCYHSLYSPTQKLTSPKTTVLNLKLILNLFHNADVSSPYVTHIIIQFGQIHTSDGIEVGRVFLHYSFLRHVQFRAGA
jgi:hypothetical protein